MIFSKVLFLLLGIINVGFSQFDNSSLATNLNSKNIVEDLDIYSMDDDDGFELHKNSSIGTLYLNVELFRDENCTEYTGFHDSIVFNFPESCNCLNNNLECWHNFLHSIYFTNFNWTANFKILYPEFPVTGNLNISKCIIESQNKTLSCIPCQGLYFEYQAYFKRGKCILIIIILIFIIIVLSCLLLYCGYWLIFQLSIERNQYTRITPGQIENSNSNQKYRFYTTN